MQRLYGNGVIRTLANPESAEAVLTRGNVIRAVGSYECLSRLAPDAERVDLDGHALLPAFLDAHSHFSSYAMSFLQVPLEECASHQEIVDRIRRFLRENKIEPGVFVLAKGYDPNALKEKTHPTLAVCDAAAPENPLVLQHKSGHAGILNTRALEALNLSEDTPAPEGGRIEVRDGTLTGYLEENAFFAYIRKVPVPGPKELMAAYARAQEGYASRGITTIQEGMMVRELIPLYQSLISGNRLSLDVVAYASLLDLESVCTAFPDADGRYDGHFKIGGGKIFLDGSPQGRTAWMRTPYKGEDPAYFGYGTMKDAEVTEAVRTMTRAGRQLLAHCNGDAAAQQFLSAVESVSKRQNIASLRPVMIHAQLLGIDQLEDVKRLGVIPSFFAAHVLHWGDTHIINFGRQRAAQISPAASALAQGIRFTLHQDTPVIEPDMLETVECAATRITKKGVLLGADERIPVREALKAVTFHAAYQYFEENRKGSIEAGKNADFVILDRDPFLTSPERIRQIKVLCTIKDGRVVYERGIQ